MEKVARYIEHHKGVAPENPKQPLESTDMKVVCKDEWDADFMQEFDDLESLTALILAANYLAIEPLLQLACAKVAVLVRLDRLPIKPFF